MTCFNQGKVRLYEFVIAANNSLTETEKEGPASPNEEAGKKRQQAANQEARTQFVNPIALSYTELIHFIFFACITNISHR